jgi:uncharacterized membrane protein
MLETARRTALLATLGLLALILFWVLGPSDAGAWWLIGTLPLLAVLPGMARRRPEACLGASFASLIYLFHALVTLVSAPEARLEATLEAGLSLVLLVAASFCARWSRPAA